MTAIEIGTLLDGFADQPKDERERRYEAMIELVSELEDRLVEAINASKVTPEQLRHVAWAHEVLALFERIEHGIAQGHRYPSLGF